MSNEFLGNEMVGKVSLHDYKRFEKGLDSRIEYMTGDQYIEKCANDIFHMSMEKTLSPVDWDIVHKYANDMKNGDKFPIPYLDYHYKQQEGRHRALAFKEAFGKDAVMPVLIISDSRPNLDEILEYCTKIRSKFGESYVKDCYITMARSYNYPDSLIYAWIGEPEPEFEPDEDFDVSDDELLNDEDDEWS
jgi:hypothetical protein